MNIATRIEQLERRLLILEEIQRKYTFRQQGYLYCSNLYHIVLGQIQALKWVEAERAREVKELGELLKEMGRRNLKRTKHT